MEIENIETDSVDLSINKNSLGEIEANAAKNYMPKQFTEHQNIFFQ